MPHENNFSDFPAKPMPKINYVSKQNLTAPPPSNGRPLSG